MFSRISVQVYICMTNFEKLWYSAYLLSSEEPSVYSIWWITKGLYFCNSRVNYTAFSRIQKFCKSNRTRDNPPKNSSNCDIHNLFYIPIVWRRSSVYSIWWIDITKSNDFVVFIISHFIIPSWGIIPILASGGRKIQWGIRGPLVYMLGLLVVLVYVVGPGRGCVPGIARVVGWHAPLWWCHKWGM